MTKKTITLSIEFSPADYASLKALAECKPEWSIDEVLSQALSDFLEKEASKKNQFELDTGIYKNGQNLYPVT